MKEEAEKEKEKEKKDLQRECLSALGERCDPRIREWYETVL